MPEAEKGGAMSNQAGKGAEISIADACEQTGLSRRTVRYYEELWPPLAEAIRGATWVVMSS